MPTSFRVYLQEKPGVWQPATFEAHGIQFSPSDLPAILQKQIPPGQNPYVGYVTTAKDAKLRAFMHASFDGKPMQGKACTDDGRILHFDGAD